MNQSHIIIVIIYLRLQAAVGLSSLYFVEFAFLFAFSILLILWNAFTTRAQKLIENFVFSRKIETELREWVRSE